MAGATGDLGKGVVRELLARGNAVGALVRDRSDPSALVAQGVDVTRGDMLDPGSLDRTLDGVSALITTAEGYMVCRKGWRRRRLLGWADGGAGGGEGK